MALRVQVPVHSNISDTEIDFLQQTGIHYAAASFAEEDADYDSVCRLQERLRRRNIEITDAGCGAIFKNPAISLGLPDRDRAIDRYIRFHEGLVKAGIYLGYVAWQPLGVIRSRTGTGKFSRNAVTTIVDWKQMSAGDADGKLKYSEEQMWDNFRYFIERVLPFCQATGMRLALHPNDPPVPAYGGIPGIIHSTVGYRKAFDIAGNSPYLGMKLCTGCWLEGGENFGNLLEDIESFKERIFVVHFRNVSSPLPYFEETLPEDGYGNMVNIMEKLVEAEVDAVISVDHVFQFPEPVNGRTAMFGYFTGYMKGLLKSAMETHQV